MGKNKNEEKRSRGNMNKIRINQICKSSLWLLFNLIPAGLVREMEQYLNFPGFLKLPYPRIQNYSGMFPSFKLYINQYHALHLLSQFSFHFPDLLDFHFFMPRIELYD